MPPHRRRHARRRGPVDDGPLYDKCENSPNSRASCRRCKSKIQSGEVRIGKHFNHPQYGPTFNYYHEQCCPPSIKDNLRFKGHTAATAVSPQRNLQDELARQHKQDVEQKNILATRSGLRECIRKFRLLFARRMDIPAFMVFPDKCLNDIVVKLPQNMKELEACEGMGPKRIQNFGSCILRIIEAYSPTQATRTTPTSNSGGWMQSHHATATLSNQPAVVVAVKDEADYYCEATKTLSCEEIVNQKFADAERDGYIIAL